MSILPCLLTFSLQSSGSRGGETSFDVMIADCGVLSKRAAKTGTTAAMHAGTMHQPGKRQSMRSISRSAQHLQSSLRGLPLRQRCAQCYVHFCMSDGEVQALARETHQQGSNRDFHCCTWDSLRNWVINCPAMHRAMRLAGMLIRLAAMPFRFVLIALLFVRRPHYVAGGALRRPARSVFQANPAAWHCRNPSRSLAM